MEVLPRKNLPPAVRGSHPEFFCQNGVLKNFAKITGKYLFQSPFFNQICRPPSCDFAKCLGTPFFIEHLRWLRLSYRWRLRLEWLLSCFLLQASILHNILLIYTWEELIKKWKCVLIVSILYIFSIYFRSTYQHIHDRDCLEYRFKQLL